MTIWEKLWFEFCDLANNMTFVKFVGVVFISALVGFFVAYLWNEFVE